MHAASRDASNRRGAKSHNTVLWHTEVLLLLLSLLILSVTFLKSKYIHVCKERLTFIKIAFSLHTFPGRIPMGKVDLIAKHTFYVYKMQIYPCLQRKLLLK